MKRKSLVVKVVIIALFGALSTYFVLRNTQHQSNYNSIAKLKILHEPIGKPLPRDWLSSVKESGQTFIEYINSKPNRINKARNIIYIRPIGSFSYTERKVLKSTSRYLEKFYGVPVKILDSISLNNIPKTSIRIHQNRKQASAKYILNELLEPNIPKDAMGYIAFTKIDLYNDVKKNFVFGLGNMVNRTGVYSIARFGDPDKNELEYKTFVSRTLKVASHELGHIFGIKHCIEYKCIMNGSNSLSESDMKPVYLCPVDLRKVCWSMEIDEVNRFIELKSFWNQNGFKKNSEFYQKNLELLEPVNFE